jgi:hypothetical protein
MGNEYTRCFAFGKRMKGSVRVAMPSALRSASLRFRGRNAVDQGTRNARKDMDIQGRKKIWELRSTAF